MRRTRRGAALLVATVALTVASSACGGGTGRAPAVASTSGASDASAPSTGAAVELAASEKRALETLAVSDPRVALRYGRAVDADEARATQMRVLLGDDGETALHEGYLDLFSFAARARGVDEAARTIARSPVPTSDAAPAAGLARPRLERELLERLVVAERARVDEERDLPRGASALVRAMVMTWGSPADDAHAARDAWAAERLDRIRASVATGGTGALARPALLELDDALDPLERVTEGYSDSSRAIAALRVTIEHAPTAPFDADDWSRVASSLRAHLGIALPPTELRARLERAEASLRADAVARLARAGTDEKAVARLAEALVFTAGACGADPATSPVRALAPAPERAPICGALQSLHTATTDGARLAVVVALHDEAVVALWSLALHADHQRLERATQSAHPFFGTPLDREARLVRIAAGRPFTALAAGLAAELLSRDPDAAERWFTFGDAPLDIVERELFGK